MRWATSVKAFQEMARKSGKTPRPLQNRPKLQGRDLQFWQAYALLDAARGHGPGGPLPIPTTEVHAFLEIGGIANSALRFKYLRLIRRLDTVYLKHVAENQPKAKK